MKKRKWWTEKLGIFLIGMCMGLTGCNSTEAATYLPASGDEISKSAYIGMVGEVFGYQSPIEESDYFTDVTAGHEFYEEIQACAEWDVIDLTEEFWPDNSVTLEFALETAVRAIGTDDIEYCNEEADLEEDNLATFYLENIAEFDEDNLDKSINEETAREILIHALAYKNAMEYPQLCEYTLATGVVEESAKIIFEEGTENANVEGNNPYQEGDVVYIAPTENSLARAIKVLSVDGEGITYCDVGPEEVFAELRVIGTYEGNVLGVSSAADSAHAGTVENDVVESLFCSADKDYVPVLMVDRNGNCIMAEAETSFDVEASGDGVVFTVNLAEEYTDENGFEAGASGYVTVEISDIEITTDLEYGFMSVEKADARITFEDRIEVGLQGQVGITVPLGSVAIQLGSTPLDVELSATLYVGADGEATITYTSHMIANVNYEDGAGLSKSLSNENPSLDIHAEVTITVEPTIAIDLRALRQSLINVQLTTGIVETITADVSVTGDEPTCLDLYIHVPLRWGINQQDCLLTAISERLKYEAVIWDSENSPVIIQKHMEDGIEVEECTRGNMQDSEVDATGNSNADDVNEEQNNTAGNLPENDMTAFNAELENLIAEYGLFKREQNGTMYQRDDKWLEPGGVMGATVLDFDMDGENEFLVCYGELMDEEEEKYEIKVRIYENMNGEICLASSISFFPYNGWSSLAVLHPAVWAELYLSMDVVFVNNQYYLVCEETWSCNGFADATGQNYWIVEYDNEELRYAGAFEQTMGGSTDHEFTAYFFAEGELSEEAVYYSAIWDERESHEPARFDDFGMALTNFFAVYGMDVRSDVTYWRGRDFTPVLTEENVMTEVFAFTNRCVEADYTNNVYQYNAVLENTLDAE